MLNNTDRCRISVILEKIIADVLSLEKDFDKSLSFAELGGQSILAIKLQMQIFKELKVRISVSDIYKAQNLEQLTELVCTTENGRNKKVSRRKRKDIYAPFQMKDMQKAYLIGRDQNMELGGEPTHAYCEIICDDYDHKRFCEAVQKLIDRFEILRYKFNEDGTQQLVSGRVSLNIPVNDICQLNSAQQEKYLARKREEVFEHKFDISVPPLIYFEVTLTDDKKAVIHFCHDGLVVDGWSHEIMVRVLDDLYCGIELPELKASYREYCDYLNDLKNTEKYKKDREYWLKWSENMPDNPEMNLLKKPEKITNVRTRQVIRSIEGRIYDKLKEYAKTNGISPFSVLMTIYGRAVARCCIEQCFLLNIPMAKRPPIADDIWDMIGECSGFMLFDFDNRADEPFIEAAKRNHAKLVELLDHDSYSGVDFAGELQQRFKGRIVAPMVFTSTIDVPHIHTDKLKKVYSKTHTSQVWIDAVLMHSDENIILIMDCVDEIIPDETGEFIADAFCSMLKLMDDDKDKLSALTSLSLNDRSQKVIDSINDTEKKTEGKTVGALLMDTFRKKKSEAAVVDENGECTYKELYRFSNSIAASIKDVSGNVGVFMNRGIHAIAAEVGCVLGGHPFMPIEIDMVPREIEACIRNAGIEVVISDRRNSEKLEKAFNGRIIIASEAAAEVTDIDHYSVSSPDDVVYIINTSGTTGIPKSICIRNEGLAECLIETNRRFGIDENDCAISVTNFCHDMSMFDIFGMLVAGGRIAVTSPDKQKDPKHWMQLIEKGKVTIWNSVPALLEMFFEYGFDISLSSASDIRLVFSGGDWVRPSLAEKAMKEFKGSRFVSVGGPSETTLWNICHEVTEKDIQNGVIPYGTPFPNTRYYILNSNMEICPLRTEGTMYVEGIGVAKEYIGSPDETKKKFITWQGKRIYNTGDRGYYREDGTIIFSGRNDFQVKINGKRIELTGISRVIESYYGVNSAVAVYDRQAMSIRAYYTADDSVDERDLVDYVKNNCLEYMVPKSFLKVDEIFLTNNGKVDTKKLLSLQGSTVENRAEESTDNEYEKQLIEICSSLLNCNDITSQSNFFLMGGNSVTAIKLISRIRDVFGAELSVYDIMNKPCVLEWAKIISIRSRKTDEKHKSISVPVKIPLTNMQEEMWTYEMMNDDSRYIISASVKLDSVLDKQKLEQAAARVVASFDILNYNFFRDDNGLPYQKICEKSVELQYINISSAGSLHKYQKLISEERMNIEKDPLYKFTLFNVNNEYSVLMITLHHIIADADTYAVVCKAVLDEYSNIPITVQKELFSDYTMKKRNERSEQTDVDISFISDHNYLSSNKAADKNYLIYRSIDSKLTADLREMSRKQNVSLFVVLMSAYCIAVRKTIHRNDLIVSVPVSDRSYGSYENSAGLFLGKVAVPIHIDNNCGIDTLADKVKGSLLTSYAQTSESFINTVRKNGLEQKLKMINNEFTFDMISSISVGNGKKLEFVMNKNVSGVAGLQMIIEENEGINCRVASGTELFNEKSLEKLMEEFISELRRFSDSVPDVKVKTDPALSVLYGKKVDIEDKTLIQYIIENAEKYPDNIAIDGPCGRVTYSEFLRRIKNIASVLENKGFKKGDVAALCCYQDPDTIEALFAIMYAGGIYVPLDNSILDSEKRVTEIISESNADFVITHIKLPYDVNAEEINIRELHNVADAPEMGCSDPKQTAYIMYTSGSTGKPKGIPICHSDIINTCLWYADTVEADSNSRMMLLNNFGFDGSLKHLFTPFITGASLITSIDSLYMIFDILKCMSDFKPTHIASVPSLLNEMILCSEKMILLSLIQ